MHRPGIDFFDSEPLTGLKTPITSQGYTKIPDISPKPLASLIPGDKIVTTNDGKILLIASEQSQLVKPQICN